MGNDQGAPAAAGSGRFAVRAIIAAAVVGSTVMLWYLHDLLLLVFAAILVAVILRAAADGLGRIVRIPYGVALLLAGLGILAVVAGTFYIFGAEVAAQTGELVNRLPGGVEGLRQLVGEEQFDQFVSESMPTGDSVLRLMQTIVGYLTSILSGLVLAVLGGIYLAIDPGTYRRGVMHLLPHGARPRTGEALSRTGAALRYWLLGQLASMAVVGTIVFIGLSIIGVPSPLALALIAGLLEFVPLIGPFIAAAPAVIIALTVDMETALLTAGLYFVVQQFEGNVMHPLIMKKAVDLPPALTLFGLFLVGGLFGAVGVLLGGPLIVVMFVMVRTLWVEGTLGDRLSDGG